MAEANVPRHDTGHPEPAPRRKTSAGIMKAMNSRTTRACFAAIVLIAAPTVGEDPPAAKTPAAVTTTDPAISLDDLRLLVKPLTRDELAHEATAWRDLLRDKVAEISRLQLATKEPERQEKGGEVAALAEDLAHSQEQRSSLLDRLRVVLDEWERKGGDPAEYRLYATAVGGLQVDVTNATTAMTVIQGWIFSEQGGIRWAWNIGKFLAILAAFWMLSLVLSGLVGKAATRLRGDTSLLKTFLVTFVRQATLVVGGIVSLAALEVNISPLLALIGGAAFVVGFALQGTLSNFAQGLIILAYRPFDVGDYIEAAGVGGIVESMNMLMTTIRTVDNKQVIVPNGKIGSDSIVNATASSIRRVDLTFGVSYTDDLGKVQGVLERVVAAHPRVLTDPLPVIKVNTLADSSVNFIVRPWTKTADYWDVYWDLTRSVKEAFDREGISIPFPQRELHVYHAPSPDRDSRDPV
jgi:small conductance mechanosensitive channel